MYNTMEKNHINNFHCVFPRFNNICYFIFIECTLSKEICQYLESNTVTIVSVWYLVYRLSALWNDTVYGK